MAGETPTWDFGEPFEVALMWQTFEAPIEILEDKEFLSLEAKFLAAGETAGYYGDLSVQKNLLNDRREAANVVYMPLPELVDGFSMVVLSAVSQSALIQVEYVPESDITQTAARMEIRNMATGKELTTKTFTEEMQEPKDFPLEFRPIVEGTADLYPTQVLRLIVEGGALPKGLLVMQWDII